MITSESINALITAVTQSVSMFLPETALIVTFILAILFDIIFKKTIKQITQNYTFFLLVSMSMV